MMRPFTVLTLGVCVLTVTCVSGNLSKNVILEAMNEAKKLVDDAYTYSRAESVRRAFRSVNNPTDMMRLMKQPYGETRSAVRAADYMEQTINLIQQRSSRHKRSLNATDVISDSDLATIARLTGCQPRIRQSSCSVHAADKYRTASGTCNNLREPLWGASNTPFARWLPADYQDNFVQPWGWDLSKRNGALMPLVRQVSNQIVRTEAVESDSRYTYLLTLFGQWTDHDLTLTPTTPSIRSFSSGVDCSSSCQQLEPCFPIQIPQNDPRFGKNSKDCIPFFRSAAACGTGTTGFLFGGQKVQRQQMNALTAFLDAGQVYGTSDSQARDLRNLSSDAGLLRVNGQHDDRGRELLPFSSAATNACATRQRITNNGHAVEVPCFVAGDVRVNENIALTALHTLFLREHNRLARKLAQLNPRWGGDALYQEARKIMGAYFQIVTFRDYLRVIVGTEAYKARLDRYPGYDEKVDPSIANVFGAAAFRFAHLTVQPLIFRLDHNYRDQQDFPSVPLHTTFSAPWRVVFEGGVDPLLRGLLGRSPKLNVQEHMMTSELRDRLFQFSSRVALDLASLNMQRGRDHGLQGYNRWRRFCGLSQPGTRAELAAVLDNAELAEHLLDLYQTPDNIDVWLGGVSEPFVKGGRVGPLFACLISKQFQNVRDGDRFWWEKQGVFTAAQRASLEKTSLGRIICDNTGIVDVPEQPFLYRERGSGGYQPCAHFPHVDLEPWREQ